MEKEQKERLIKRIFIWSGIILVVGGLCVALTFAVINQQNYKNELENLRQKSYFDAMDSLNNIDTKLKKVSVSDTENAQQTLLNDVWRECELAGSNLSQLSSRDEGIYTVIKFLNQLGDYCYYLATTLSDGNISAEDTEKLDAMAAIITDLRDKLQTIQGNLAESGSLLGSEQLEFVNGLLTQVSHETIDYPEMIYDGPFSDGLTERDPVALKGLEEVTEEHARNKLASMFPRMKVKYDGEVGGNIPSYMYELRGMGRTASAQISKAGGQLVYYNLSHWVSDPKLQQEECAAKAEEFVKNLGYDNMKAVWVSNVNSTVYVTVAYMQDDIICYPDLIKLQVAADDGDIIGYEAQNYLYNHTERTIDKSANASEYRLNEKYTLVGESLALIPTEWNTEVLTKEFVFTYRGSTYYKYVNLSTGEEERVLVVVENEGTYLM